MCCIPLNYFLAIINKKIMWALAQKHIAVLSDPNLEW